MTRREKDALFGDHLEVLRTSVPSELWELIDLDPPFDSNATRALSVAALYERRLLPKSKGRRPQPAATASGEKSAAPIHTFEDIRQPTDWGLESEAAYNGLVTQGPKKLADSCRPQQQRVRV